MAGLRKLIWSRWSGRLLAVCLAYLLAVEALVASIGMGMSAAAAPGQPEFSICSSYADDDPVAPPADNERNKSDHRSQCPFCFVAAQNAVHMATIGDGVDSPPYAELQVTRLHNSNYNGGIPLPAFYRTTGDPRGPPQFSV
jgi:Protein of unknown function (DUF2946)